MTAEMRPHWLIEIKWSDKAASRPESWHAIEEFIKSHSHVADGVFTSRTVFGSKAVESARIDIVPASIYCHTVGRNTAFLRGMELVERDVNPQDGEP